MRVLFEVSQYSALLKLQIESLQSGIDRLVLLHDDEYQACLPPNRELLCLNSATRRKSRALVTSGLRSTVDEIPDPPRDVDFLIRFDHRQCDAGIAGPLPNAVIDPLTVHNVS